MVIIIIPQVCYTQTQVKVENYQLILALNANKCFLETNLAMYYFWYATKSRLIRIYQIVVS